MPTPFVWFDVTTRNTAEVQSFYADLLGWPVVPAENAGAYTAWIMDGQQPWGGVVATEDATSGRWLPYARVDDLDVATEKATKLGATVVQGQTEGPAGTAVTIADPGGALLALWVPRAE